jgi:beta-glucosidase
MGSAAFGSLETHEPLTDAQIDAIARGLLLQLSLDEKISTMHGGKSFFEGYWAMQRNGYYRQPRTTAGAIPRLAIPGVRFSDGPRGFHGEGATTFPQGSARGASWDTKLEERIGDAMGREARALGSNMIGAPCINLARHPAWGRAQVNRTECTTSQIARLDACSGVVFRDERNMCVGHDAMAAVRGQRRHPVLQRQPPR